MKKERDDDAAHELRDRPVPPVKGNITDRPDICPRPEQNRDLRNDAFWGSLM